MADDDERIEIRGNGDQVILAAVIPPVDGLVAAGW
jgi:hypothetical protein